MGQHAELLAGFDAALDHAWESLETALAGLSPEEARYRPDGYEDAPQEPGWPLPGSALWHIVHLAECYHTYSEGIRSRPRAGGSGSGRAFVPASELTAAVSDLRRERATLREVIAVLTESELGDPLKSGRTVAELIRASIRHDAWHGGMIVMARRMWRASPSTTIKM